MSRAAVAGPLLCSAGASSCFASLLRGSFAFWKMEDVQWWVEQKVLSTASAPYVHQMTSLCEFSTSFFMCVCVCVC